MKTKQVAITVLGKEEKERRIFFFKYTVYNVAISFKEITSERMTLIVPFEDYCALQVGQEYDLEMHSLPDGSWTPYQDYAESLWEESTATQG